MEYSVIRRGGAEKSIVILTPQGHSPGTDGGVDWKVKVTDSLISGARKDPAAPEVKSSEIFLHVTDTYKAWTTNACEVPWDMEGPMANQIPLAKWPWGVRSLVCAGAVGENGYVVASYSSGRGFSQDLTCDESRLSCVSRKYGWTVPNPEGLWSDDSGWITYQDGVVGESWTLRRIGNGELLGDIRVGRGVRIMDVRKQDKWTFAKTLAWRSIKFGSGKSDTTSGFDSTRIMWTALERVGNSGQVGTWKMRRDKTGRETDRDTIDVDFDSPSALTEERDPPDLPLTVFRRVSWPPFEGSIANNSFGWSNTSSGNAWSESATLGRFYIHSEDGDFLKMEQTYSRRSQGYLVDPGSDSNTTIELLDFERSFSSGVSGPDGVVRRYATPRTLGELDRLVEDGGRILSIRDVRGARLDGSAGTLSEALRKERGVFLFDAVSPEGDVLGGRVLRP